MTTLGIEQRKLEERILRLPRLQIYSSTLIKDFYLLPAAVAVKEVVQVVILFLFPVSLLQLPCVFSKQLLYMPIRILETLAREIGDRTVSVRSIHNDRKDNLVCFFFDSFTSLTLPFSELLFENPAKNDGSCRHQIPY